MASCHAVPELPEVEKYRRYLTKHGLRQRIAAVRIDEPRSLRDITQRKLSQILAGHAFTRPRDRQPAAAPGA